MTQFRSKALICLGGNQDSKVGHPAQTLLAALLYMAGQGLTIRAVSRFFSTPSFPGGISPDYVNATICITADLSPPALLNLLHRTEGRFGRARDQRWGSRTLDLDLLAVGQAILPDKPTFQRWHDLPGSDQARLAPDQLILPHPRIQDRAFVLVPLMDIAPDWVHPVLGHSVADLGAKLSRADVDAVRPL
jgi:2-amino-4-hydroxy-6-hydroxymethyldihydropteridine diphosphokinase